MKTETSNMVIYKPFKAGFPNFSTYVKDIWERKDFLIELSRTERDAEILDTFFGRLWGYLRIFLGSSLNFFVRQKRKCVWGTDNIIKYFGAFLTPICGYS